MRNNSSKRLIPEDAEELRSMLDEKSAIVDCYTLEERRDVIEKLLEFGFVVNGASLAYLPESYTDFSYPNPGMDGQTVACYRSINNMKNYITYEDFAAVFKDDELCVPTGTEFQSALSALLGI